MFYLPQQVRPSSLSLFPPFSVTQLTQIFSIFKKKMMYLKHFLLEILVIPLILTMSIVKQKEKPEHFLQYIIHSVNPYCCVNVHF